MYLKSLEIQGFKSFPDKTVLQFGNDITAIVGPNGSGKSNISDAISWVMGEQSSKALRGAKMEDVIFGGTQKRAPVGFAEATLTLDNQDGALRIETPEVMITRRYYRSGESEYFINRQSARLRDIHEMLMDTGLGREGYSNIGQGRIDEILSVKSTDRREIFEEAAGISKCRYRKEETERRLESTEDNLLRIGDKISELEMQVEPLREQAEKAKKYLVLREELKGFEVTVWLDTLGKLNEANRKAVEDYTSASFLLEQAHSDLNALYTASEQLALQLNRESLLLDEKRDAISEAEQLRQKAESDNAVLAAERNNRLQNMDRIRQEISEQQSRSGGIAAQIDAQKDRIEELQLQLKQLDAQLQELLSAGGALGEEMDKAAGKLLQNHTSQSLLSAQIAAANAEIASVQASREEIEERRKMLEEDHAAAMQRRLDVRNQAAEGAKRLEEAKEAVASCSNIISGYSLRLKTRRDKQEELRKRADEMGVQLSTAEAKIRMLREMERDYEGFSKAVKTVMQEAERGGLRGVHGPISALIRTEDQYTTAIEIALGAGMQNIVVDTEEDGKAGIQLLKRREAGRVTFQPLSVVRGRKLQKSEYPQLIGFVGIASDLISFDEQYRPVLEKLLGRVVIAENLDSAIKMARSCQNRLKIVTLDGQVMDPGGSMTGGSVGKSSGVLTRTNELERLEKQRLDMQEQLKTVRQAAQEAASSAAKTEFELTTVQGQLRQAEDEVLRRTEEQKQIELLLQALQENLDSFAAELNRLNSRSGMDEGKLKVLQQTAAQSQTQLEALRLEEQTLEQTQSVLQERNEKLNASVTAIRMDAASKEAEQQASQDSILQLQSLSEAMQGDRAQKEKLLSEYTAQVQQMQIQIESGEKEIAKLERLTEQRREDLRAGVEHRSQIEARRNQTEKDAQEKNQSILLMERECARLEQKKATGELEEKQIIDKLWDSYELTPGAAQSQKIEIESLAAANKRIGELRRKISALGTPNLGAIDEFARVNERYEYLTGQRDDVLHSKSELENIIRTITDEMTDIFVREFNRINTYFGETFTEMFGGGKAELRLEDPSQPLECGIEIRVQPPGKQVKTISLLSGGEKAFVAIALYFSILKVRPTPFCMLDEIDAALDDRNVERYATYMRNLCKKTQFIVITHRRGTMEAADMLYGVTMQEQGISKVLHLRMDEMVRQLGIPG